MTETNIGKLFAAGILPGILATLLLCLAVQWTSPGATRRPGRAASAVLEGTLRHARGPRLVRRGRRGGGRQRAARLAALRRRRGARRAGGVRPLAHLQGHHQRVALFVLVMGGIYGGVFTAIEGAGIGAFGALVLRPRARARCRWRSLYAALVESARTTAMLFADPDRRADVRRVRQHHLDARRPEELRHRAQRQPDHGGGGDLRHLRAARHGDGGAVDDPADGADLLPADRAHGLRPDLVRRPDRGGGRDRADQPAGRA